MAFGGPERRTLYWTAGKTLYRFPVNVSGLVRTSQGDIPFRRRNMFSAPAPPSICWNSVTTSTQEKKCGRYTTDWITDRILLLRMELSRIANATSPISGDVHPADVDRLVSAAVVERV